MSEEQCLTFAYKRVGDVAIHFDVFLPPNIPENAVALGAVVSFHAGGLACGNRKSWFPHWLHSKGFITILHYINSTERVLAAGHAFILPDYRLMPSGGATGHDILEDIIDFFGYLKHVQFPYAPAGSSHPGAAVATIKVDPHRIAVAGCSAGGLCAYLAAMHVTPKPKAVLSLYSQGGDFTLDLYIKPKTEMFYRGRPLLDTSPFTDFVYPFTSSQAASSVIVDVPLIFTETGYPANPRQLLARVWLQLGVYVDYFVGQHEPSLSERLWAEGKQLDDEKFRQLVPPHHRRLIPQLNVTSSWPPTFFAHGRLDTATPLRESEHMYNLLRKHGVETRLRIVEDKEHSFDFEADAEKIYGRDFDEMADFLILRLKEV